MYLLGIRSGEKSLWALLFVSLVTSYDSNYGQQYATRMLIIANLRNLHEPLPPRLHGYQDPPNPNSTTIFSARTESTVGVGKAFNIEKRFFARATCKLARREVETISMVPLLCTQTRRQKPREQLQKLQTEVLLASPLHPKTDWPWIPGKLFPSHAGPILHLDKGTLSLKVARDPTLKLIITGWPSHFQGGE